MRGGGATRLIQREPSAFVPVLEVCKKYEELAYIMDTSVSQMVLDFENAVPPPTLEQYVEKIRQYHAVATDVASVSEDEEYFQLLKVDTLALKDTLRNKALELRDAPACYESRERQAGVLRCRPRCHLCLQRRLTPARSA